MELQTITGEQFENSVMMGDDYVLACTCDSWDDYALTCACDVVGTVML